MRTATAKIDPLHMIGMPDNSRQRQANQFWAKHFYEADESAVPDDFLKRPQPDPTVHIGINDQVANHLGVV